MRRMLSLALAAILALGMGVTAFAAAEDYSQEDIRRQSGLLKVTASSAVPSGIAASDILSTYRMDADREVGAEGPDSKTADLTNASRVKAVYFYLVHLDKASQKYQPVTAEMVRLWDLDVALRSESEMIKDASLVDLGGAYAVEFEFYAYLDSTSTRAFDQEFCLTTDEARVKGSDFTLKGKLKNRANEIFEDDTEISMYDDPTYRLLDVKQYIRSAEIALDCNMTLITRLFSGRKVYLRVSDQAGAEDIAICEKYGFDNVVSVYSVNAKSESASVFFDLPEEFFVYTPVLKASGAEDGETAFVYLGRSDESLPLADQYFFSLKEINAQGPASPPSPAPSVPSAPPTVSAPPAAPSSKAPVSGAPAETANRNANFNPGTGY